MLRAAFSVCGSWCLMSSPVLAALLAATVLNAAESCGPAFDGVRSGGTRGFVIFQMQLELLRRYADGVVLWGGCDIQAKHPRTWDENAAWWVRTKAFAATVTPG